MIAEAAVVTETPVREAEQAQVAAGLRLDQHIDHCPECFGVVQCRPGHSDFCFTGRKLEKQWKHAERKAVEAGRVAAAASGR